MKILLTSVGTRGDMEPFLAIGEIFKEKGHQVICAFPEQFRHIVEEANMEFASLGSEFIEMLDSDIGKAVMGGGGSGFKKLLAFVKLARMQGKINKGLVRRQFEIIEAENPDRIIHNAKAIYPVIWEVKNKGKTAVVSPVPYLHYVENNTHVAFNNDYGTFLNKLTFRVADWGLVKTIISSIKWLEIKTINKAQIEYVLENHKIIYTISPSLFPQPLHWKKNMRVLGYLARKSITNWKPDNDLLKFIGRHPKLLFITFGSMTNPEPEKKTRIFLDILERNNIPTIINTASGGLEEPKAYNRDLIHFVSGIPYDWIFSRVFAVIHHGGSGTTHMALKNGCATMIIPHIIDQFVWNRILYQKESGPKGIKIGKISTKNLEPKILDLINNSTYKRNSEHMKAEMEKEDFASQLYEMIVGKSIT